MKTLYALIIACLCIISINAVAQTKTPKTNTFSSSMSSVLLDYRFNFKNISGELELAQGEIENYTSLVTLPDAESCLITRYHSVVDTTASWQAIMFRSETFEDAAKRYQQYFKQLNNCKVKLVDGSVLYLKGVYEAPKEEMSFTTSTLRLETSDERYKNLKVELEIVSRLIEWVVNINVGSKVRDEHGMMEED